MNIGSYNHVLCILFNYKIIFIRINSECLGNEKLNSFPKKKKMHACNTDFPLIDNMPHCIINIGCDMSKNPK